MSLGHSKIIHKSSISDLTRQILLTHEYFTSKDPTIQTNFIKEASTDIDKTVLELLTNENIDYSNKVIEYWFQYQTEGGLLTPHCDFNCFVRKDVPQENVGEYLKTVTDLEQYLSPITLSCYLEVSDDMVGGNLCISNYTWEDNVSIDTILNSEYEKYFPTQNEVLHFYGSTYYHWIDKVISGTRKSMLINLWPNDIIRVC